MLPIHNIKMSRNIDIALLRTFVAIADHGSMTAAGNALHLSQSAVSQQIARLEGSSGSLFSRDRRGIRLTSQGERLLAKARRIVVLNDELWREMNTEKMTGLVRIGAPYDLVSTWLAPILKTYLQKHPSVEVIPICAASPDLLASILSGKLDLALIEEPLGPSRGDYLTVDRLAWVGAKAGTAHLRTPLPVSLVAENCVFRPAVVQALSERDMTWRTIFESGSIDATIATVRSDLAVTAWLTSTVPADLDVLPLEAGLPELPPFAINLHMSNGNGRPAATGLARHIRESVPHVSAETNIMQR